MRSRYSALSSMQWNRGRLAQCLLPTLNRDAARALAGGQQAIDGFAPRFEAELTAVLRRKLGLGEARDGDLGLAPDLLVRLGENAADFTLTFRRLAPLPDRPARGPRAGPPALFRDPTAFPARAQARRPSARR